MTSGPDDRLYFRQLLSGRDFATDDQMARQMVNFKHGGEQIDANTYPNLAAHTERMHALEPFAKTIEKESGFIQKIMG